MVDHNYPTNYTEQFLRRFYGFIASLLLLTLSFCQQKAPTENAASSMEASVDSLLQATINSRLTPGVAVAIVSDKEVLYSKSFGTSDIQTGRALKTTDIFNFSSIIKTITSTAVMQLVENGEVVLDSSVTNYLPVIASEVGSATIRQMLSHSSGIQFNTGAPAQDGTLSAADLVQADTPGAQLKYSNAAFYTLGKLVEKQSEASFPDYVSANIFAPLDMKHSSVISASELSDVTSPHTIDSVELKVVMRAESQIHKVGYGVLYSTIEDMSALAQTHLNKGTFKGQRLLSTSSYQELWKPNLNTGWDDMKAAAGLGWFIGDVHDKKSVSHIGGTNGYSAALVLFPDDDRAIVLVGNSNKLPREDMIATLSKMIFP